MIVGIIPISRGMTDVNSKMHELTEQGIASFMISQYNSNQGVIDLVERCDAIVVDANINRDVLDHPYIYGWNEKVEVSHTEKTAPEQIRAFMKVLMRMYRTHLEKNADYSPANIQGPGMIGIATRMWDKMVRIMNLTGFDISAKFNGFHGKKKAKNEPYLDAFMDIAVYGVIAQLLEADKWGK